MTSSSVDSAINGKQILITGGTGSFGNQIATELLKYSPKSVVIYSRDEKKQYDMQAKYKHIKFVLGDVRNYDSLYEAFHGIDVVFHAAALKQVPNCELHPYEAVRTNVQGAENIRRAAIANGVQTVIAISTDKAVKPVNVMGMSKALQERIILNTVNGDQGTKFVCVRYGNVLGSRGSVVPLFHNCIKNNDPLPITHPDMTRFALTLTEAVSLVLLAAVQGVSGDLWVRKMPACNIVDLAKALSYGITGRKDYPLKIVGARPGEKIHEVLVSEEEMWRAEEMEDYFRLPSWTLSEYKHGEKNQEVYEYSSDRTHQMSIEEILEMLRLDGWVSVNGTGPGPKG